MLLTRLNVRFGEIAAPPNNYRRDCEQMLRKQWLHLHKAGLSCIAVIWSHQNAALGTNVSYFVGANIGGSNVKEGMMAKRTEYLVTQYASDSSILKQLRVPKSVNLRLFLERLICQDLDDDAVISSCLRSNSKRFYDPFQVIDMREEHRRDQARDALNARPETKDPIGVYNRARDAQIPLGKTLMVAGVNHDYFVKEVEV